MSARQIQSAVSHDDYTYVNEDNIDPELKCIVCQQPFIEPYVGKQCGHTFCYTCIHNWYKQNSSCPSCRINTRFEPLTTRVVLSQLDRLLVRCLYCNNTNIERGNFNDHIRNRCHQIKVKCKAAHLKCSWTGRREEQVQHEVVCPLIQIQPIIEELKDEILAQRQQLQIFMNDLTEQLNYLQEHLTRPSQTRTRTVNSSENSDTLKNRYQQVITDMKHTWTNNSCGTHRNCRFCLQQFVRFFKCLVCSREVARANVGSHDYSSPEFAVICRLCVNRYA